MTTDEIRKQIIGDVVEEFAGVAGEKPTYAEAFVSAFGPQVHVFPAEMKYMPFDANNPAHVQNAEAISAATRQAYVRGGNRSELPSETVDYLFSAEFERGKEKMAIPSGLKFMSEAEQVPAPPEPADESKKVNFREFI